MLNRAGSDAARVRRGDVLVRVSVSGRVGRAVVEGGQDQIREPEPPQLRRHVIVQGDHRTLAVPFDLFLLALSGRELAVLLLDPLNQLLAVLPPSIPRLT